MRFFGRKNECAAYFWVSCKIVRFILDQELPNYILCAKLWSGQVFYWEYFGLQIVFLENLICNIVSFEWPLSLGFFYTGWPNSNFAYSNGHMSENVHSQLLNNVFGGPRMKIVNKQLKNENNLALFRLANYDFGQGHPVPWNLNK